MALAHIDQATDKRRERMIRVIPIEPGVYQLRPQLRKFPIKIGDVDGKPARQEVRDLL